MVQKLSVQLMLMIFLALIYEENERLQVLEVVWFGQCYNVPPSGGGMNYHNN